MTLYEHAERELGYIKCTEPERSAILGAVKAFESGLWTGGNIGWGIDTLTQLLRFKPLSKLSGEAKEWVEVGDGVWQSVRRPTTFSRDGGRSWYDIEDSALNNGDVWKRDEAEWETASLGSNVEVGCAARVALDVYEEGRLAELFNGREGEITGVTNGRCALRFNDGVTFRFAPDKLQVLKSRG